jgi:hypothetical protein
MIDPDCSKHVGEKSIARTDNETARRAAPHATQRGSADGKLLPIMPAADTVSLSGPCCWKNRNLGFALSRAAAVFPDILYL